MKKVGLTILAIALCLAVVLSLAGCNANQDWKYIEGKGKMIIGYTIFEPMNYSEDGKFIGFDTELAEAVCAELGVDPVFQLIDWDNKFFELNSKTIDCVWNGFTVNEERAKEADFSVSYLYNKQIAVIRKADQSVYTNKETIKNGRLVAEAGSAGEDVIKADFFDKSFLAASSQINALLEVKANASDIAIVDSVMAEGTLTGESYNSLMIVQGLHFTEEEYGIAFRKDSPDTVAKVNAALKKLWDDGTIGALAGKYNIAESLKEIK